MAETPSDTDLTPGMQLLDRLDDNKLAPNIMHFGRVLRAAGLPSGRAKSSTRPMPSWRWVFSRSDFYWALHAVFVNRHDMSYSIKHSISSGKTRNFLNG